ncbi:MAG: ketoacyl-ACP synthase III [Clostridiales bacterium]|nr:ketoacyl-ACP synthase III [Clostridiales bacterium]
MRIIGTGSCLPETTVSNNDLAAIMDTSDEWISTRTGIRNRHIAVDETTTSMALEASKQALEAAQIAPEELDMIIAGTVSPDYLFPTLSCEIQAALGAVNATAFDLSAGCSGFLFALATADAYFKTGGYRNILLIGAETLSKMMDWDDRSTCVLFGDGAGAAVVTADEDNLAKFVQGSDGASGMALYCDNRPVDNPFYRRKYGLAHSDQKFSYTHMDGQAVYRFAVKTVPTAINQVLDKAGITLDDVDMFLLHQANLRIIESVAKHLKQPMEKFPTDIEQCGNSSAASVPILLNQMVNEGRIKHGDTIVMAGFGAGLTWGACVIKW